MWRNRNLWILLSGEAIAGFGMWAGIIGNLEFLQHTVPSDTLKSLIIMCNPLVGLLLGPLAGKVIDTYPRKPILNLAGLLRIISVLFMFVALATGHVWWMVVYMLTLGTSAAFFFPAWQSTIPMVVPRDQLLQVNSVFMTVSTMTRVLGTVFSGILLAYVSLETLYTITIVSYVGLFFLTLLLQVEERVAEVSASPVKGQGDVTGVVGSEGSSSKGFMELWPMLKRTPAVLAALLLCFVPALFLGGFNLIILKISELQGDASIKGWLYAMEGAFFLIGTLVAKRVVGKRNLINVLLACTFIFAFAQGSLIMVMWKPVVFVAFAAFGFAAGVFYPILSTVFQKGVEASMHGRFFALTGMLDRVLFQVVLVATGVLLDLVGFQVMEIILALASLALATYYTLKQLRQPMEFREERPKAV